MCGIAGIVGEADPELAAAMVATLAHRGPDGDGLLVIGADGGAGAAQAALGHRRLAIIDLEGGSQPMTYAGGRYAIVYNGELYNYRELRDQLREFGEAIAGESDTEVILAALHRWGPAAVDRFEGMFALALWDRDERSLLLLRDRVGVKPLYYAILPRGPRGEGRPSLAFASEPKALLALPAVDRGISAAAVDAYLELFYVPPPLSIFAGIRQLPPAHRLTWREDQLSIERYWDAPPAPQPGLSHHEWAELVTPVLDAAIVSHMVADVPVGAFLSGGVDSSTIVGVMAARSSRPLTTVCVGYGVEGASFDERAVARRVADYFGTEHHEIELDVRILDDLEAVVRGFDEPFGSWTALLAWHLCRFTRQHVKVAVAGDGGDELFGGYPRYRGMLLSGLAARAPGWGLGLAARGLAAAGEPAVARSYRRWARAFVDGCRLRPAERYARWVGYFAPDERDRLLSAPLRARLREEGRVQPIVDAFDRPERGDLVERSCYADLHGFLPENVLRGSDRMSMAHGLEVRVPFCDHRLIEVMARVPSREKVGPLASKRLLKTIVGGRLPAEVTERRKLGFNAPFGAWMRDPGHADRIRSGWLARGEIAERGILDPAAVDRLWDEHQRGARDHGPRLWALIVLATWLRLYA
ncbi:MAG: asparagine synthase (glutamine-hydrolyzing) [Myxococcales bacterium]|nr:asparagine synthase (glutamine-hydrolyzing) [Myxococcales bacterium]